MFRHTVLIALALFGTVACAKTEPYRASARGGCIGCHGQHNVGAGSCESCHRGDPGAARKALAHDRLIRGRAAGYRLAHSPAVRGGERWVDRLACRRCHVIGNRGNRLATSLDRAVWKREQSELERSIREPAEVMPRFALSATQTETVVAYLLHSADPEAADPGYQVRFTSTDPATASKFDEHCGGCHRALLAHGPAGQGSAGPNLSGLLTPHYPPTARGDVRWTAESLREWLRNPRAVRVETTMRPLQLDDADWSSLIAEFAIEPR